MAGFSYSELIDAAPRTVFDFLVAVENAPKVLPAVKETKKLNGGPLAVGTRYQQTRQEGGKELQFEVEVVEFEAPFKYAVRSEREGIHVEYRYTLDPDSGGTRVHLACEVKGEGPRRPLAWFVAQAMRREDANLLTYLERAIIKARGEAGEKPA